MDLGTIIVQVTAVIGGIAALIAIFNGIYELREKRQRRRAASRESDTQHSPSPPPTLPASPPASETVPTDTRTQRRSNIGVQITRLIGREAERLEVERLLLRPDVRLVTLTGPAGIGKTRLALHVATGLRHHYSGGVFLVALDAVTDPVLVPSKIAQVLDVREQGGQQLLDSLKDYLREKHMLLVLDNFEQVVTASAVVAELLAAAPRLQALVTSREVLRLSGEHVFAVPPLALPDLERVPEGPELVPALTTYEAVRLFVERASAAKAGFALTSDNAVAVAGICNRLDGLPLAIELAAARVRLLSPPAILERLVEAPGGSPLHLLTGGARDLPARQQTLRSTIGWSYDLLDQAERDLFDRLGVFAGGWTLEAAEAVADGMGVLDGLESLVDKSLVRQHEQDGDGRFTMLQTIREYAIERLEATGQADGLRQAHADFYLRFTEQAEPKFYGATQVEWLKRVETEHDNLRAALDWTLAHREPVRALRLAGVLWRFWYARG
ncbi:MAG TPA: NB-ARC domain-containing protein, partial [Ardenticatenaceae bacterium]|nr:NB-ARC domain-containing protein [Ardenticatenaceae bacterium]